MELSILGFVVLVGVPVLLGASLLRSQGIGARTDPLAWPGWAWLAGSLAIAALEGLRLLLGLASPWPLVGPALLVALGSLLCRRRPGLPGRAPEPWSGWHGLERGLFVLVVALVLVHLTRLGLGSSLSVVHANDEANFWALRAKLLYDGQGFGESYALALLQGRLPNSSYPILNPLLQVWVFDCAGGITHVANRFPTQIATLALVLCTAGALRRVARPWLAGALLIALGTCAPMATAMRQANSDVLVALGALVAVDALQRGRGSQEGAWVVLGALACSFLLWSKREGTLLFLCGALGLLAWEVGRRGWRQAWRGILAEGRALWPWSLAPMLVLAGTRLHNAWFQTRGSHELRADLLARIWSHAEHWPGTLTALLELGARPATNAIPLVFLVLALVPGLRRRGSLSFLPPACLLFVLVLSVALFQGGKSEYLLRNAALRVMFQVLPLMLLWLAAPVEPAPASVGVPSPERRRRRWRRAPTVPMAAHRDHGTSATRRSWNDLPSD